MGVVKANSLLNRRLSPFLLYEKQQSAKDKLLREAIAKQTSDQQILFLEGVKFLCLCA
jgi:restriction endonuclease